MSLREHERRILAEIERQLSEEEPELAGRLASLSDAPSDLGLGSWKPWVACGLIAAVTAGLLVLLFVLTPSAPQTAPRTPAETSEATGTPGDAVLPEAQPAG
ncbi:DUF3040 domain-containing protein [Nocardiopsis algeriensis]|uniref:DUF3040 domain-containing protein n=1 Tax=Nocardiopsis algeriensis TaxID=1478215 RepID=A0A841IS90_9ACTN|nr:DUF3040 domain-containing protein [Nocardiopsis algeriensis]MBB6120126.1 hypothetical protein [Nocardiopsis algeriensis]